MKPIYLQPLLEWQEKVSDDRVPFQNFEQHHTQTPKIYLACLDATLRRLPEKYCDMFWLKPHITDVEVLYILAIEIIRKAPQRHSKTHTADYSRRCSKVAGPVQCM